MKNKRPLILSITYIAITLVALLIFYIALPAINPMTPGFWLFLTFLLICYIAPVAFKTKPVAMDENENGKFISKLTSRFSVKINKIILIALIPLLVAIIGGIASSTIFNAKRYANVISVTESDFEKDIPQTENVKNVALMDTHSARIIGNRALGELSDVVSQYEVSDNYVQINYQSKPKKVATLEYADFFKWIGNKKNGIPGYIMVDPVENTAEYVSLSKPIKYSQSAYFGQDLDRKLRFTYPTKIFGQPKFEIDEEGNPYYIVPCMKPRAGLFGAMDVNQVILFDPCSGNSELFEVHEVPTWVDIVYDGDLATKKYDWKGTLSGGWFNSVIGNKGCKHTTDDFGYIVLGDDVWYYTGVTSVTSDKSNIGFILTNARTGIYKFYPIVGAEEHSAMGSAEGEVQEKGYVASFPVLINVRGQATYIMVLKDNNGIVKLYALVNVVNFSVVAIGNTQSDAMTEYIQLMKEKNIIDEGTDPSEEQFTITVNGLAERVINNTPYIYIETTENGKTVFYKINLNKDESAIFINTGDTLKVERSSTETDGIYLIINWEKA